MKARQVIGNSSFGPDQVQAMGKALDDAWTQLAPSVDDRPEAARAARFTLADIILSLGAQGNFDAEWLANTAVQLMVSRSSRFQTQSPAPDEGTPQTQAGQRRQLP